MSVIDILPVVFAVTHAVLGLSAILSLAKFGSLLSWLKMIAWIFFIAAIPLVGVIVWFTVGRRRMRARAAVEAAPGDAVGSRRTQ